MGAPEHLPPPVGEVAERSEVGGGLFWCAFNIHKREKGTPSGRALIDAIGCNHTARVTFPLRRQRVQA